MSYLITVRIPGDAEQFRSFLTGDGNADRMKAIAEDGRSRGAIHHRFGVGDGFVFVVDEWEDAQQFQDFFEGNEEIEAVIRAAGGQGEPEVTVAEALETADQF
jgi:heme-degrading monooxygenase HmoA